MGCNGQSSLEVLGRGADAAFRDRPFLSLRINSLFHRRGFVYTDPALSLVVTQSYKDRNGRPSTPSTDPDVLVCHACRLPHTQVLEGFPANHLPTIE
jgi:hypothetical protein